MKPKKRIAVLLAKGKKPKELLARGFNKGTITRVRREMRSKSKASVRAAEVVTQPEVATQAPSTDTIFEVLRQLALQFQASRDAVLCDLAVWCPTCGKTTLEYEETDGNPCVQIYKCPECGFVILM